VELPKGCDSEGGSQGLPGCSNPRVLGIPASVFNKNSTLKALHVACRSGLYLFAGDHVIPGPLTSISCLFFVHDRACLLLFSHWAVCLSFLKQILANQNILRVFTNYFFTRPADLDLLGNLTEVVSAYIHFIWFDPTPTAHRD